MAMNLADATTIVKETLQLEATDPIPATLARFLEASKTTPSGLYRPYIAIIKYWRINPPRGGILEGEQVKWKDTLEDQLKALNDLQTIDDGGLPEGETIPIGWGVGGVDLPIFSAFIV